MARLGLGDEWKCLFANDCAPIKINAYTAKWGASDLNTSPIERLTVQDLPSRADLAWASFPCQDLSVAGNGLGIGNAKGASTRSGALWPFLKLLKNLRDENRDPGVLVLENVPGLLTANSGKDFTSICRALGRLNYVFGAVIVDAKYFVPQSRPRVFIIAVREHSKVSQALISSEPVSPWHSAAIIRSYELLPPSLAARWRWWQLGESPKLPKHALLKAINVKDTAEWNSKAETKRLLSMMTANHEERLSRAKAVGGVHIGSLHLRMRPGDKRNIQRAEIDFGATLGCLRTPRGGASRPRIIVVDGKKVRTRLLSPKEAGKLMGLGARYPLPSTYEHAFQVIGDGVVAPVVRFIADRLLERLVVSTRRDSKRPRAGRRNVATSLGRSNIVK